MRLAAVVSLHDLLDPGQRGAFVDTLSSEAGPATILTPTQRDAAAARLLSFDEG